MKVRLTVLFMLFVGSAVTLGGRAAWIQLGRQPKLAALAKRQFQSQVLVQPRRGVIEDRNGEHLAGNVESPSLAANPNKVIRRGPLARMLAQALELPYQRVLERLREKREFVWLKRQLTDADLVRLKKWRLVDESGGLVAGLFLIKENRRAYPHGTLASQVLGSVDVDSRGLEGVELWQDQILQGKGVSLSGTRDALGRPAFLDAGASAKVRDGEPVRLTLDASLQFAVEETLRLHVARTRARSGSVAVMNATTGEILALAGDPAFDPNQKGGAPDRRRNRIFTDGFEPGSTVKALVIAGALMHGWKLSDQVWGERGSFMVQGKRISEAEAHEKFEWLSLARVLQVSSNVGAAKIALRLGPDALGETLQRFGLGTRSGVGFPGEIVGRIPPRKWQPLTTANIGFGHGLLVTPIQMLRAFAALANGGWLIQPSLLKSPAVSPAAPKKILTDSVARDMAHALEGVTIQGTGKKAVPPGYRVAGKTGTAQMVDAATGRYSRSRHITSFIGFPMGVEPKLVVMAVIHEPQGPAYFATDTAAPLFRDVLSAALQRLNIAPTEKITPTLAQAGSPQTADRISLAQAATSPGLDFQPNPLVGSGLNAQGQPVWKMPLITGLSTREALRSLQGHAFYVEVQGAGAGSGLVLKQFPEPGKDIAEGDTIRLVLFENGNYSEGVANSRRRSSHRRF